MNYDGILADIENIPTNDLAEECGLERRGRHILCPACRSKDGGDAGSFYIKSGGDGYKCQRASCGWSADRVGLVEYTQRLDFHGAVAWLARKFKLRHDVGHARRNVPGGRGYSSPEAAAACSSAVADDWVVALRVHPYGGDERFAHVRMQSPTGGVEKRCAFQHGDDLWRLAKPDQMPEDWRYPILFIDEAVLGRPFVWVEGEWCAVLCRAAGLHEHYNVIATPLGVTNVHNCDWRQIPRGATLYIWPDGEERKAPEAIAEMAARFEFITRLVTFEELGHGEDIADLIAQSGGAATGVLPRVLEQLEAAPLYDPDVDTSSDWEFADYDWLFNCRMPMSDITILYSVGGLGKGLVLADLARRVTRGEPWMRSTELSDADRANNAGPGGVVYITVEQQGKSSKNRAKAVGADMALFHLFKGVPERRGGRLYRRAIDIFRDIAYLESKFRIYKPRLVIIDPISNHIGRSDMNAQCDVRTAMAPLLELSREMEFAILAVSHTAKNVLYDARSSLIGSSDWRNLARSVWMLIPDAEPGRFYMVNDKMSDAAKPPGHVGNIIASKAHGQTAVVAWEDELVHETLEEVAAELKRRREEKRKSNLPDSKKVAKAGLNVAIQLARARITDAGGSMATTDLEAAMRADGYFSRAVIREAMKATDHFEVTRRGRTRRIRLKQPFTGENPLSIS